MENKNEIRRETLKIRNGLDEKTRCEKSRKIARALESRKVFKEAVHILFYYAMGSEVSTRELIEKYRKEKKLYLPVIQNETEFHARSFKNFTDLIPGAKGVPEPRGGSEAERLDLIIVPGVAFDAEKNRLGMGKGYYDRFLSRHPDTPRVGLAFSEQMVDRLPKEDYDMAVDQIITDTLIY